MKKQILLFMAGGLMVMASCNQPTASGPSDAQIDSMVNVRVEEIRAEMMAHNDSIINALAQERADSIIAAMTGKKVTRKAAPKPKQPDVKVNNDAGTATGATSSSSGTIGNGKPKMGNQNDANTIGNGKPKMGNKNDANTIGNGKPKIGNK